MDDPELYDDETILIRTPDVFVKSIPFEAVLTDRRIIFIDRKSDLIPPKEVPVSAIRDVEAGENAIRDPTLTLQVAADSGGKRQMVMTFSGHGGSGRARDRDEWARALKKMKGSPVRNVISALSREKKIIADSARPEEPPAPVRRVIAKEKRPVVPIERMRDRAEPAEEPEELPPAGSFCTKCGNRLPQNSAFCNRCGARVMVSAAAAAPQEEEQAEMPRASRSHEIDAVAEPQHATRHPEKKHVFGRAGPVGEKRSLLGWLFPKRRVRAKETPLPAEEHRPRPAVAKTPPSGSRKKVLIIIAAIVIVLILGAVGVFVAPKLLHGSSDNTEKTADGTGISPTAASTTAAASVPTTAVVVRTTTQPTIPATGVYVKVSYIGAWKGSYGVTGSTKEVARSGEVILQVEDAKGTVEASFQKDDTSTKTHTLSVEIYKNGTLLKGDSTTVPQGRVSISANVGSG